MNFSKQLKKYRELNNLSQEALAEKIYVTRQTISKWENDRTYPDIHNLIALSILFDISLDELVKGDVKTMKSEVSKSNWNFWIWSMGLSMILTPLSIPIVLKYLDTKGLIISFVLACWLILSSIKLEQLKKVNNLKNYAQIVAFIEGNKIPDSEPKFIDKHKIIFSFISAIIAIILLAIGFIIF